MAVNLSYEFNKFARYNKQLRNILRDTKLLFHEINKCNKFDADQVRSTDRCGPSVEDIDVIVNRSPSIILVGQNTYAKAFIINELFDLPILPSIGDQNPSPKWRPIRFIYGNKTNVSLCVPGSYELVEDLAAYNQTWKTVPLEDIELNEYERCGDSTVTPASMEVSLNHPLLKDDVSVVMTSQCYDNSDLVEVVKPCLVDVLPILVYAISQERLSEWDVTNLKSLKEFAPNMPVIFFQIPPPLPHNLIESSDNQCSDNMHYTTDTGPNIVTRSSQMLNIQIFQQLCTLTYLSMVPKDSVIPKTKQTSQHNEIQSRLVDNLDNFCKFLLFVRHILQAEMITACTLLDSIHSECLRNFILTAFDMNRDLSITPRRIDFVKDKESDLYLTLMDIAMKKQNEIKALIMDTIERETPDLLQMASDFQFTSVDVSADGLLPAAKEIRQCSSEIKELMLSTLNTSIAGKLTESVEVLRDSYTGTLTRCLTSLEDDMVTCSAQQMTTHALQQILNAAYQVEITVRTSSSLLKLLFEQMKQIVQSMPWNQPPTLDAEWKRTVASDMLNSLSESKLARSICFQIRGRLKNSHDAFLNALSQLEYRHLGRLQKTEEQRLTVRNIHAPVVARMALESVSLRDVIMYGMPHLGREIGRGQYGVVYACSDWAGYSPCAIKSVVPSDEKHFNDLALECYYTKNIPEHNRIVPIFGSVIDYTYAAGSSPAVLLVMPRLQRDLYSAIKSGLDLPSRLHVALDVVEGVRFLHSQGLVHRDIKLKNVLLDRSNRGAITDLGFCKPEAMMSGSIVGTPIHMSPELFTGKYDNTVDVYAFGILFWYICAGHVRLPFAFEQCTSKDMLWSSVKKGVRPERLEHFEDVCWELMTNCWEAEPEKRPLLGNIQPVLQSILVQTTHQFTELKPE